MRKCNDLTSSIKSSPLEWESKRGRRQRRGSGRGSKKAAGGHTRDDQVVVGVLSEGRRQDVGVGQLAQDVVGGLEHAPVGRPVAGQAVDGDGLGDGRQVGQRVVEGQGAADGDHHRRRAVVHGHEIRHLASDNNTVSNRNDSIQVTITSQYTLVSKMTLIA